MSSPIELDAFKQFRVEICQLLRVLVENFQDAQELPWHLLQCTRIQHWRSTEQSRHDWLQVDSVNRHIYGALKGLHAARLISIMNV